MNIIKITKILPHFARQPTYSQTNSNSSPPGLNTSELLGSLADVSVQGHGFLAFLRLIGVVYYMKNVRAFSNTTPMMLYQSLTNNLDVASQHVLWYNTIRDKIWE